MSYPERIEGLAVVSADDMIADATGEQPPALKIEADQRFFYETTANAGVLVCGRHSGNAGPGAALRPRLLLTRRIAAIERDTGRKDWVWWNPAGATLEQAWDALGGHGVLVVIGGTDGFGLFLELGYDAFYLSRTSKARLPGGRPVFPGIPPATAEALLAAHGLTAGPARELDAAAGLTLTTWRR